MTQTEVIRTRAVSMTWSKSSSSSERARARINLLGLTIHKSFLCLVQPMELIHFLLVLNGPSTQEPRSSRHPTRKVIRPLTQELQMLRLLVLQLGRSRTPKVLLEQRTRRAADQRRRKRIRSTQTPLHRSRMQGNESTCLKEEHRPFHLLWAILSSRTEALLFNFEQLLGK